MRKIRGLLLTVITLLVCIVLAELFLAFIAPVPDPYGKIKYLVVINQYIKSESPPDYLIKLIYPTNRDILEQIRKKSNYREKIEIRKSAPITNEKPRLDVRSYTNNLKSQIGLAKSHGIQLVFMTQQTTWNSSIDPNASNWHWMLYRNGKTYSEEFIYAFMFA